MNESSLVFHFPRSMTFGHPGLRTMLQFAPLTALFLFPWAISAPFKQLFPERCFEFGFCDLSALYRSLVQL